ncbi:hypothetical protein [Nocardioides sp. GXQ0305]|uniref:hypothetical protein n=1 Tax=Nocardioides sp. GXQ0305 TaxID=3423912 RepID=UPI003D7D6AD1
MEDDDRRAAPLVAYAGLVCGGVFACLLLLAGPAQADGADPGRGGVDRLLPLDQVGERVGDATREVGRVTSERVRDVSAPAAPLAPAGDRVSEQVATTTDRVAAGAESVTRDVDEAVDVALEEPAVPLPEPPVPTGEPPPTDEPDEGTDGPTSDADRAGPQRRDRRAPTDVRAVTPDREAVPRGVRTTRTTDVVAPAPAPVSLITSPTAGAHASAVLPEPGPLQLVAGCDDCAASGTSSGDPLHVFGLPSLGVTAPRLADVVPRDAGEGGPSTIFRRPDVSPD